MAISTCFVGEIQHSVRVAITASFLDRVQQIYNGAAWINQKRLLIAVIDSYKHVYQLRNNFPKALISPWSCTQTQYSMKSSNISSERFSLASKRSAQLHTLFCSRRQTVDFFMLQTAYQCIRMSEFRLCNDRQVISSRFFIINNNMIIAETKAPAEYYCLASNLLKD